MEKKILFLVCLILLVLPLVYAGDYDVSNYNKGLYGVGEVSGDSGDDVGSGSSGGSSSSTTITPTSECSQSSDCGESQYCFNDTCHDAECFDDSVCDIGKGETCWENRCVKMFDVEILEFESPVKVGGFFDFKYFLKAVAEINGDVEIRFWIEQDGNVISSGLDTIYFNSYEEKTKTKKLFLPEDISSGTYVFYIEVTYGTYTASAHRTIGIEVEEGFATIRMNLDSSQYIIYGLIGLGILIVFLIFYIERRKIKKGLISEGRWIKKHRVSILVFLVFIILGILAYCLKWYELVADWIPKAILWGKINIVPYSISYWYYILGGIVVFIFIIGLIVLLRRKFGKEVKFKK